MAVNKFPCPGCRISLRITTPELVGKKIRCPKCGTTAVVPGPGLPAAPKPEPAAVAAVTAPPAPADDHDITSFFEDAVGEAPKAPAAPAADVVMDEVVEEYVETNVAPAPAEVAPLAHDEPGLIEEAVEDEDEPAKKPAPAKKKKSGKLVPLFVGLLVFGYVGALVASLLGLFDTPLPPPMSKEEALKVVLQAAAQQPRQPLKPAQPQIPRNPIPRPGRPGRPR
jgi:hypothetical protein